MKALTFTVYGKPRGKARPRMTKTGHIYTPKENTEYEGEIKEAAQIEIDRKGIIPWTENQPVKVMIDAYFQLPKSANKKLRQEVSENGKFYVKKSDADNIAKIICDALNGIAYKDDSQVAILEVRKKYTACSPYVDVVVKEIEI